MQSALAAVLSLMLLGISACSPSPQPMPRPSQTPAPSATGTLPAYEACGWQWAEQSLPDVTAALHAALTAADLPFDAERTRAFAIGENCLDASGNVVYFATMETDFAIAVPADAANLAAMGDLAGEMLGLILAEFAPGTVPGPQLGRADFAFFSPSGELHKQVRLADAQAVLESGAEGEALFRALFP